MHDRSTTPIMTRRVFAGATAAAGLSALAAPTALAAGPKDDIPSLETHDGSPITLEIYKGFALKEFHRWDAVIRADVQANSPAGRGAVGLETLKKWNQAFHDAFRPRVDLIDHFVAGNRGMVTVNLHWKHDGGPFAGIAPTGQSGTSVESFLLRLDKGMVTHWDVADNSLDLATYLHDHGFALPRNVAPPALIKG